MNCITVQKSLGFQRGAASHISDWNKHPDPEVTYALCVGSGPVLENSQTHKAVTRTTLIYIIVLVRWRKNKHGSRAREGKGSYYINLLIKF